VIIRSLCQSCLQPFTITVQGSDAHLVRQLSEDGLTAACPRLCGGRINLVGDPVIAQMSVDRRLKEPLSLTVTELYRAVNGMGLPDEVPKSFTVIKALFKANPLKAVDLEEVDGKFYLHELHLDDGVVVHLAAGSRGAQILKITKERDNGSGSPR
jgi:hypothetical protein